MTTRGNVLSIAPELTTASVSTFNLAIADSQIYIGSVYGRLTEMARRYYVAHCVTVWTVLEANASGAVQSEKAGRASVSYGQGGVDEGFLGMTKYGRMLLNLRRKSIVGVMVV
jgi:hypothetical protein